MFEFKYVLLCLFLVSCDFSPKQKVAKITDKENVALPKDTLIIYDIDGISTEGAGTKVNYVNGKITESVTNIYAGTWQASVIYEFQVDKIKVTETKYLYKTDMENVKSDEDMQLIYEISYFIDYKGSIIGDEIPDRMDIFKEFKKAVPFELK